MVDRPLLDLGQMLRANFHVRAGPPAAAWDLTADRPAIGMVHMRFGRVLAARDVDHVAIGVCGEPGQISGVVIAELARVHRLIFDHYGRHWNGVAGRRAAGGPMISP
jgi:hypothetical protein